MFTTVRTQSHKGIKTMLTFDSINTQSFQHKTPFRKRSFLDVWGILGPCRSPLSSQLYTNEEVTRLKFTVEGTFSSFNIKLKHVIFSNETFLHPKKCQTISSNCDNRRLLSTASHDFLYRKWLWFSAFTFTSFSFMIFVKAFPFYCSCYLTFKYKTGRHQHAAWPPTQDCPL